MKIKLDPRAVVTTALASLLLSGNVSAHPGHYGHGVDPSVSTGFLDDLTNLGPFALACALTCFALFLGRSIYRNLP